MTNENQSTAAESAASPAPTGPVQISDPDLIFLINAATLSINLVPEIYRPASEADLRKHILAVNAKLTKATPPQ